LAKKREKKPEENRKSWEVENVIFEK